LGEFGLITFTDNYRNAFRAGEEGQFHDFPIELGSFNRILGRSWFVESGAARLARGCLPAHRAKRSLQTATVAVAPVSFNPPLRRIF
jgi:hypothetical protein